MTTVAWDGKRLSSDRQASSGEIICSVHEQKIYTPPDGANWQVYGESVLAIGCSGDCGAEMELADLLSNNLKYSSEFLPTFSFAAIAVVGINRAYIICKGKDETRASISLQVTAYAIGSGGLIARTAMHCGKNAEEAVRVAIEMDCFSGGGIDTFATAYKPISQEKQDAA